MRICSDTDIYPEASCVRGPFLIAIIYSYLAAPFWYSGIDCFSIVFIVPLIALFF